jgi:prophage antirepressor-like protein
VGKIYRIKNDIERRGVIYTITAGMDIVKAFNTNDLHTEIVIKGTIDDPLFRASDVGVVLELSNIRATIVDFDDSEKVVNKVYTLGGAQEVTFLTEKGLYKVLFRSRKPIAQKFQNWVCEVIKEIRLKGIYKMENEIKKAIEEKNEAIEEKNDAIEEKNKIREKTLIENFPSNVQCVYYGTIDNKSDRGERLIKFGNSNSLKNRIYNHKKTYQNFRLINAFKVENKLQIENAIKDHPLFIERQRTIMIKKHNFTELINMEGISDSVVDETIREIIRAIEYSPEKYLTLLEENKELKRMIGDNTPDYIISLKRELEGLKKDNMKLIKKLNKQKKMGQDVPLYVNVNAEYEEEEEYKDDNVNVTEEELENYNTLSAAIKSKNMMRDNTDGKYHIKGGIYEKIRGTREEVWCGTAYQTTGELKKRDLEMNKHGRVVSKVKLIRATMENNFIKYRGTKFPL